MKLIEYPDRDALMLDLAQQIADELDNHLLAHGNATLVVPGGTTPAPMFASLSAAKLDWSRITVAPSDERQVPVDHPRSNARMIREALFQGLAANAGFVPLYPDQGAADRLNPHLPISVLVLGMGADMHTASLFPGADQLAAAMDNNAPPVMEITAPGADEPRITLTAPVLKGAVNIHVLITGDEKRDALEKAQNLSPQKAPISCVLQNATVHWAR